MNTDLIVLLVHMLSCAFMTGLIWTIQMLHYPAFASVREDFFVKFHSDHSRTISFMVGPVMLAEIVTASLLTFSFPAAKVLWINNILLGLIWGFTFLLSVPLHDLLSKSQNQKVIDRLVATNWPRTILWSIRLFVMFYFFIQVTEINYGHIVN